MDKYDKDLLLSNLRSYLETQGIDTSRLFKCINPNHHDENASMKYFDDNHVFCFGCRASYDLINVISIMENVDNKQAYKRAIEYYGKYQFSKPVKQIIKDSNEKQQSTKNYELAYRYWRNEFNKTKEAKDYMLSRGISNEVIKKFNIGYKEFDFGEFKFKAVIIPVNKSCFTARNIENSENNIRYYKPKGCHIELFNKKSLTNSYPYCFITEGEFDCLSFETIGANAIALCSANNTNKFIKEEKDVNKTYIISLDNDEMGKLASDELAKYFEENNIKYCFFYNCNYKDANQALVNEREKFEKEVGEIISDISKCKKEIEQE